MPSNYRPAATQSGDPSDFSPECPLVISAEAPTLSVGAREKLTDVIDLVLTNPETASVEQIREVASLARLLLRRYPA
nr:hypothetical protein GCM10017611_08100 [Rhodococcus wratislaviensis]